MHLQVPFLSVLTHYRLELKRLVQDELSTHFSSRLVTDSNYFFWRKAVLTASLDRPFQLTSRCVESMKPAGMGERFGNVRSVGVQNQTQNLSVCAPYQRPKATTYLVLGRSKRRQSATRQQRRSDSQFIWAEPKLQRGQ